jgi:hypothetical protein
MIRATRIRDGFYNGSAILAPVVGGGSSLSRSGSPQFFCVPLSRLTIRKGGEDLPICIVHPYLEHRSVLGNDICAHGGQYVTRQPPMHE